MGKDVKRYHLVSRFWYQEDAQKEVGEIEEKYKYKTKILKTKKYIHLYILISKTDLGGFSSSRVHDYLVKETEVFRAMPKHILGR